MGSSNCARLAHSRDRGSPPLTCLFDRAVASEDGSHERGPFEDGPAERSLVVNGVAASSHADSIDFGPHRLVRVAASRRAAHHGGREHGPQGPSPCTDIHCLLPSARAGPQGPDPGAHTRQTGDGAPWTRPARVRGSSRASPGQLMSGRPSVARAILSRLGEGVASARKAPYPTSGSISTARRHTTGRPGWQRIPPVRRSDLRRARPAASRAGV